MVPKRSKHLISIDPFTSSPNCLIIMAYATASFFYRVNLTNFATSKIQIYETFKTAFFSTYHYLL